MKQNLINKNTAVNTYKLFFLQIMGSFLF